MRSTIMSIAVLGLVACDPAEPSPSPSPSPVPAAAPAKIEAPVTVAAPAVSLPPAVPRAPVPAVESALPGVGPSGAEGRTARQQAVFDVLSDGSSAGALVVAATAPGRKFDPALAEKLAPKPVFVDRPVSNVPVVRQGAQKVKGPLEPDIVRRIVRAHINEIRYCYNQGLTGNPRLAGRVVVDFQVLTTGKVGESKLTSTTLPDQRVSECVVAAPRRWTFPAPATVVDVSYPFEFAPAG